MHTIPPRTERVPAYRARQSHLPELRHRGRVQRRCNLRFDDTNPAKEDVEYVESIQEDVRWLGFDWDDRLYYASDYFERMYACALELIRMEKAYVDSLTAEEIGLTGDPDRTGKASPYRDRSVEENLDLFERMRAGSSTTGPVLRARIDMSSPNLNMRDPRSTASAGCATTGRAGVVYLPDVRLRPLPVRFLRGITHSICTLEFEDHRPLYDWFQETLGLPSRSQQIEFARLNLSYTVMSKRKLLQLVREGLVGGWDDPRMPTLCGLRRRGYTPASVRNFCERIGVGKRDGVVDVALLEHTLREDLNARAPRVMAVLRPLRLIIDNYPADKVEMFPAVNNPEDPSAGTREVAFSRELLIEREDFMEDPPKKFFRLAPGRTVRLRYACLVTCTGVVKDERGEVVEVHCRYHPRGEAEDLPRARATLHWVSAPHSLPAEVRLYDRLFLVENPGDEKEGKDFKTHLNPGSLEILDGCRLEASLGAARPGDGFQFERLGYFCMDPDSRPGAMVFNRTVALRDAWAKIVRKTSA